MYEKYINEYFDKFQTTEGELLCNILNMNETNIQGDTNCGVERKVVLLCDNLFSFFFLI